MLKDLEAALVRALHADDAAGGLAREAKAAAKEDGVMLGASAGDGFRITALLVQKLRFEAVVRGDSALLAEFERDPRAFTEEFRAFCSEVEPREFFPREAAAAFRAWRAQRSLNESKNPRTSR